MSTSNDDRSKINFDADWECFQQTNGDILNTATIYENHQWSSITLPHFDQQNSGSEVQAHKWWYRKEFHWIASGQQVHLYFKQSTDENNSNASNGYAAIWLNQVPIFSGSLLSLEKPIELTQHLLSEEDTDNILLILCSKMTLSFHARLLIYGKVIYASGQIQLGETKAVDRNEKNVLQYTVSLADDDGRIEVDFGSEQSFDEESEGSSPREKQKIRIQEPLADDIPIPRLAIAILIVGTRGDVQPFIA